MVLLLQFCFNKFPLHVLIPPSPGVLQSPGFPSNYPNDLDTTDTIEGPEGSILRLTFTHFHIQGYSSSCKYDYITIDEWNSSSLLEKSCGSSLPPVLYSSGSAVRVIFHTVRSSTVSGWSLSWAALTPGTGPHCRTIAPEP
jgi:hypothetical protein